MAGGSCSVLFDFGVYLALTRILFYCIQMVSIVQSSTRSNIQLTTGYSLFAKVPAYFVQDTEG